MPDESVADLIGTHTCTEFKGDWCSIWGTWSEDWYTFDINTGEGIETIGVDPGAFDVTIASLGGLDVQFNGLWWGGLSVNATYDPETKTFVFPLQTVWGGYTFCNSSMCEKEVPTAEDVVPATAVVGADGSITMNYTVEYYNYPYLYATQVLDGVAGPSEEKGDANGDGVVDATDIAFVVDNMLSTDHAEFVMENADLNGDGVIDSVDIALLIKKMLE